MREAVQYLLFELHSTCRKFDVNGLNYINTKTSLNTLEEERPEAFAAISKQITAEAVLLRFNEAKLEPHRTSTTRWYSVALRITSFEVIPIFLERATNTLSSILEI